MAIGTIEIQGKKFNWNCCNSVIIEWVKKGGLKNMAVMLPLIEQGIELPYPECYLLVSLAIEKAKQENEKGNLVKYSKSMIDDMFDALETIPVTEIVELAMEMIMKVFGLDVKKKMNQEMEAELKSEPEQKKKETQTS